jgi:hypothetical protein
LSQSYVFHEYPKNASDKSKEVRTANPEPTCRCGAHQLHRFYRYVWEHPSSRLLDVAHELKISNANARQLSHRLKLRAHLERTCPQCFEVQLFGNPPVCQACGCEPTEPTPPIEPIFDAQYPTNALQRGNGLGSVTDYRRVGFENHYAIIERRMRLGIEESLILNSKSDVMQRLKTDYPSEELFDLAGRLVLREVKELKARYPLLINSKYARQQVVENALAKVALIHPSLAPARVSYAVTSH